MADSKKETGEESQAQLTRDLGLFKITMMGVGMMVGAGVFVATGIAIGEAGPGGILITFALNGLLAFCSTMAYAELASAMPGAGGGYSYVKNAFGGVIGFLSGWMSWFGSAVSGSLYAITFSTYTLHLLKAGGLFSPLNISPGLFKKVLAILVALIFAGINYLGSSETGTASIFITMGQTAVLVFIGISGIVFAFLQPDRLGHFSNFLPNGWGKILATMGFTYVGFEGYEIIAQSGEETINPKKNIPKALFLAIIIVTTLYLLVAFAAVIGAKPGQMSLIAWFNQHGSTAFAEAITDMLPFGGILVSLAAILSSTSALNATTFSSSRVSFAMGRDGYLPEKLGAISKKRNIPHIALMVSTLIIIVMAIALPVKDIAAGASIMFLGLFLSVNLGIIKIRRSKGNNLNYGYLMPFFPVIPITSIVIQLVLSVWVLDVSKTAWLASGIWIISGLLVYFGYYKTKDEKVKTF